jgi:DNA-directed RNA polymerase subunit RPC12/RpoP
MNESERRRSMQRTSYRCSICEEGFETQNELEQHEREAQQTGRPEGFRCPTCGDEFISADFLNAHLLTHPSSMV